MKLTQGSLLRPTWEYEIVDWKLVVRQKSFFSSHESVIALQSIDPTPRSESWMDIKYIVVVLALLVPIVFLVAQALTLRDFGYLGFTLFFWPFLFAALYKFMRTKYDHVVFDHYEANAKSTFRLRKNSPSRREFEDFVDKLSAEAKKFHYRDDIPADKKVEIILRHLDYLRSVELLSDKECEELAARARKKLMENKLSVLRPTEAGASLDRPGK